MPPADAPVAVHRAAHKALDAKPSKRKRGPWAAVGSSPRTRNNHPRPPGTAPGHHAAHGEAPSGKMFQRDRPSVPAREPYSSTGGVTGPLRNLSCGPERRPDGSNRLFGQMGGCPGSLLFRKHTHPRPSILETQYRAAAGSSSMWMRTRTQLSPSLAAATIFSASWTGTSS
jgi:hypothetical protein